MPEKIEELILKYSRLYDEGDWASQDPSDTCYDSGGDVLLEVISDLKSILSEESFY